MATAAFLPSQSPQATFLKTSLTLPLHRHTTKQHSFHICAQSRSGSVCFFHNRPLISLG
jgi:hypothetical protein